MGGRPHFHDKLRCAGYELHSAHTLGELHSAHTLGEHHLLVQKYKY